MAEPVLQCLVPLHASCSFFIPAAANIDSHTPPLAWCSLLAAFTIESVSREVILTFYMKASVFLFFFLVFIMVQVPGPVSRAVVFRATSL